MNVCFNFLAKKHQEDNGRSVFTALIISYPPPPPPPTPSYAHAAISILKWLFTTFLCSQNKYDLYWTQR